VIAENICKSCRERPRTHYSLHCLPCNRISQAEWRSKNPERARSHVYKSKFGIDLEQYRTLLEKQGGLCAVCLQPETINSRSRWVKNTTKKRALAVDHDHKTGKVRGLLCSGCNTALGKLGDDEHRIRALLAYLQNHEKK
jgi:hypothetical protein